LFEGVCWWGFLREKLQGFYPGSLDEREQLESSVFGFFKVHISEEFELNDRTFDCYITRELSYMGQRLRRKPMKHSNLFSSTNLIQLQILG
jgi:hypothetical protein